MPVVISTTNTPGLDLVAVVDKVDTDGVDVSPALRWHRINEEFTELGDFVDPTHAYLSLQETDIDGYYEYVLEDVDGSAENLRLTVLNNDLARAIGVLYNIPLPLVNPSVTIDLTVEEDRD